MSLMTFRPSRKSARSSKGLSLIELGLVMVFISLAMVPIVRMIGGPQSGTGEGNTDRISSMKSREAVLANTMVEKVLSGDFDSFDCNGAGNTVPFNPNTDLPSGGQSRTYGLCRNDNYNTPLFYQWSVLNLNSAALNGFAMPAQNDYYQATFNVLNANNQVILTLPTYFFHNKGAISPESNRTGMILALDTSGSMGAARNNNYGSNEGVFLPWMYHRYDASHWNVAPPAGKILNMWDNSQLDLVYGQQIGMLPGAPFQLPPDPNANTPFNEAFPYPGKHGGALPANGGLLGVVDCTIVSQAQWAAEPNASFVFLPFLGVSANNTQRQALRDVCDKKNSTADWSNKINTHLPRIEAIRTAALSLLVNMESNPTILSNIEMGFINWNASTTLNVPMEAATTIGGGQHFQKMREELLWINRADQRYPLGHALNKTIRANGGTRIDLALQTAAAELLAKDYNRRVIVLMTDGEPNGGGEPNTPANLTAYANSIGNGEPDPDKRITIFAVGLINANNALMNNIANATPNGQAFIADDITDLTPIFESIAYQSQKLALLSISDRYGVKF